MDFIETYFEFEGLELQLVMRSCGKGEREISVVIVGGSVPSDSYTVGDIFSVVMTNRIGVRVDLEKYYLINSEINCSLMDRMIELGIVTESRSVVITSNGSIGSYYLV